MKFDNTNDNRPYTTKPTVIESTNCNKIRMESKSIHRDDNMNLDNGDTNLPNMEVTGVDNNKKVLMTTARREQAFLISITRSDCSIV